MTRAQKSAVSSVIANLQRANYDNARLQREGVKERLLMSIVVRLSECKPGVRYSMDERSAALEFAKSEIAASWLAYP